MVVNSHDVQRLFLQAVLSRRYLSQKLALKIWERCVDAVKGVDESLDVSFDRSRNGWDAFVAKLNDALNPLDLEFAHAHDEIGGHEMYAIVNRRGDEIAQLATDYSPVEIAYFKGVVEQIMLAPNESFCVSSLAALREVNSLKSNMTKSQAEVVLGSFVAKGWLMKTKRGRYSLSTRTMLELQQYLRTEYESELLECTICMETVTRGVACYTPACKTRLHAHCLANYKRGRSHRCPTCNDNWGDGGGYARLVPVGEAAFREGQDQGRRRARQRSTEDAEGDSDEDKDDEDVAPAPKKERKGRRAASEREESMAVDDDDDDKEDDDTPPPTQKRKSRR